MANKYPKISRLDNYYRLEIDKDKDVFYVEEKLDGSNVTISIYDEKTIRLFSRTTEIDQNEPGN
ncbi:UNVERIFIED_CONTAM: RNA ligase family protein [Kocuria sp. CPCC 205274]